MPKLRLECFHTTHRNPIVLTPFGRHQLCETTNVKYRRPFADNLLQSTSAFPCASSMVTFSRLVQKPLPRSHSRLLIPYRISRRRIHCPFSVLSLSELSPKRSVLTAHCQPISQRPYAGICTQFCDRFLWLSLRRTVPAEHHY